MDPMTAIRRARAGQREIVIVGGGFGGLTAAKTLAADRTVHVTVVDRRNHHLFQPLLYQVATAGLNPADIAVPIRSQFSGHPNVAVHLGEVTRVDLRERQVTVRDERRDVALAYDYLILACGARHSYFGRGDWEEYAPGLKTLEQAVEIRRRILSAFEAAENEFDPEVQRALLTFVVVGGGPTGVELAGAIADISRTVLVRDFRRIDPASARVVLVEAGPRILAAFPEGLAQHATADLRQLGVEVHAGTPVDRVDADGVSFGGERLAARSVFWAAGVQAEGVARTLGVDLDRAGRVKVAPDLSIPGHPEAFVIGDLAHAEQDGEVLPGLAPVAIQAGRAAARNILASIHGRPRTPFRYFDKGMMATIGKHKAITALGRARLTGYLAWIAWLFVHILYLIGFRNRVAVLAEWSWSYLFSRRGARLITGREWRT
ncbi:MAG: NAD(P)/FAD-dependent oxidoreductase [Acidobacteriota bacterium]|nr:NAD(P)/FAD-dependent oxidoreductase [Acidobacteriota bacterium]